MDKLITAKELARMINRPHAQITPQKIAKWGLPVVRLDHRRLFRMTDVEALIARSVVTPPSRARRDGSENAAD